MHLFPPPFWTKSRLLPFLPLTLTSIGIPAPLTVETIMEVQVPRNMTPLKTKGCSGSLTMLPPLTELESSKSLRLNDLLIVGVRVGPDPGNHGDGRGHQRGCQDAGPDLLHHVGEILRGVDVTWKLSSNSLKYFPDSSHLCPDLG